MIDLENIKSIVDAAVKKHDAFVVDLSIDANDLITLEVDNSEGINLSQIALISREIESQLDRDEEDFSLEVASPGVGKPLRVKEQYGASVGRAVKVSLQDGTEIQGDLTAFENDEITVQWKERVPKEIGKGKRTVQIEKKVSLDSIKETRLEVRFK